MSFWKGFEKKALDAYDAKKCQVHAQNIQMSNLDPQLAAMEQNTAAVGDAEKNPKTKSEKAEEKVKERKTVTEKMAFLNGFEKRSIFKVKPYNKLNKPEKVIRTIFGHGSKTDPAAVTRRILLTIAGLTATAVKALRKDDKDAFQK